MNSPSSIEESLYLLTDPDLASNPTLPLACDHEPEIESADGAASIDMNYNLVNLVEELSYMASTLVEASMPKLLLACDSVPVIDDSVCRGKSSDPAQPARESSHASNIPCDASELALSSQACEKEPVVQPLDGPLTVGQSSTSGHHIEKAALIVSILDEISEPVLPSDSNNEPRIEPGIFSTSIEEGSDSVQHTEEGPHIPMILDGTSESALLLKSNKELGIEPMDELQAEEQNLRLAEVDSEMALPLKSNIKLEKGLVSDFESKVCEPSMDSLGESTTKANVPLAMRITRRMSQLINADVSHRKQSNRSRSRRHEASPAASWTKRLRARTKTVP